MTPLTITKDEYSGKWVAWRLPSDQVIALDSEMQSKAFWNFKKNFYLIGAGETEQQAIEEMIKEVADFVIWVAENHKELSLEKISSNLPEYRNAIFEFNTEKYF